MKHIILGTAGHVDHGKTTLVKALTGIDTDRLKEEKERGITIELGFAYLTLPSGQVLGVVDVPGHERFVKNMVAGAGGIDLVAMVIAADEGVMPQTREHLHICSLLGIKKGLVALTKTDLVDPSWLELVLEDLKEFLQGTFLASSPIIPVSAVTGEGLQEFLRALEEIVSQIGEEADSGVARLPVDRVFTMRGFGTVVTGTLLSGRFRVGEEAIVLPGKITARIRGIQVYNKAVDEAEAGQRTAINLQGVEKAMVLRGDVLAHLATLEPSRRLDVSFEYLGYGDKKMKNRSLVRLHVGTSEIIARILFLECDELRAGERAYAQLVLESPAVVMAQDRFVVRSYSPITTIGGGVILDPQAVKLKSRNKLDAFPILHSGKDSERVKVILERSGLEGITLAQLTARTAIPQKTLRKLLEEMYSKKEAVLVDSEETRSVSFSVYKGIQERILEETKAYHERFPLKEGLQKEELRTTLGRFVALKLFNMALRDMEKSGRLVVDRENIRLAGHSVALKGGLEDVRKDIALIYRTAGLMPPYTREVMVKFADKKSQVEGVLGVMLKEGSLVKINEDLLFDSEVTQKLKNDYQNLLMKKGRVSPADFKELTGLSRKFVIPLMEYFDVTKLTIREGEHRILRKM